MNNERAPATTSLTTAESWSIDADAPLQAVFESPECPPLVRQTLSSSLSWQARNETPVRRALASPHVAPYWLAALLALGATITIEDGNSPTEIPLETLIRRKAEGRVSALHIQAVGVRWGEAHVARTPADEPIVAAVAALKIDESSGQAIASDARVALTGVWPEPVRLAESAAQLTNHPLDKKSIRTVAEAVEKEVAPKGDFLGSEEYRRAMARVLTSRALGQCLRQETEDE